MNNKKTAIENNGVYLVKSMENMVTLRLNNNVSERDMDMLFVESALTDIGFCNLLIDKTDLRGKTFRILSGELSKSDNDLGESDITLILEVEGFRYGFLIEDKIDAAAMPDQHERYVKRGRKGVKNGDYADFKIFIFCPAKYYRSNDEAKLYEHLLTYEECRDYFDGKNDPVGAFRSQQLKQALYKAKKPPVSNVDEKANSFLRQYIGYQKENFPSLDLSTKEDKNGWWTDYRTELGKNVYINHKIREGYVDLTFVKASDKTDRVKTVAEWVRQHKISNAVVVRTANSAMIRLHVPKLDMEKGFESVDKDELNQCFEAVRELTDFANMIETVMSVISK